MAGAQAQGSRSRTNTWTKVMDLLSGPQRAGQTELINQIFGELENIRLRPQETYAGISDEGERYRTQLKDVLGANLGIYGDMANTQYGGISPEFKAMLSSNIDAPTMEAAGEMGRGLKLEGAGGGHFGNRQSSDMYRGNMNIADRAVQQIAQQRTGAILGEQQRGEDQAFRRRQMGLEGLAQTGQSLVGLQDQERALLNEASAFRQAQQQNQLNALLAMLGLGSQITSSVTQGLGQFSKSKTDSGGGGIG